MNVMPTHQTEQHQERLTNPPTNKPPRTLLEAYRILNCAECSVLDALAMGEGKTTREIAGELLITPKSLENYITRLGRKLELRGKGKLRGWATKQNKKRSEKATPQI